MPGRARWRRTSAAAARHTGERWPCHLRCDARACTRAHARALHERCMNCMRAPPEKLNGMAGSERWRRTSAAAADSGQACCRALAASSALPCACTHACACASHDALHALPRSRTGRRQGRPCTRTSVWRAVRSIARDRIAPCALWFPPLLLLRAVSRCRP